jgi:hypothetical protein
LGGICEFQQQSKRLVAQPERIAVEYRCAARTDDDEADASLHTRREHRRIQREA